MPADLLVKPMTTPPVILPSPEPTGPLSPPRDRIVRHLATLLAAALLVLGSACTEVPDGAEEPTPVDPDAPVTVDTTPPDTAVDPPNVDPDTVTPPMVVEPAIPTTDPAVATCLPTAVAYPEANIPALPADVIPALCTDQKVESEPLPDNVEAWTHYSWDPVERILVVEGFDLAISTTTTFWLDSDHRVRQIVAEGSGGFYVVEDGSTTYRFDESGNLVYKRATRRDPFADGEPLEDIEKRQTWNDAGQITSRIERDLLTDTVLTEIRWTWDADGRLVEGTASAPATGTVDARTTSAAWTYDTEGRPTSVVRTQNDVEIASETWTWDEDGHLAARTASETGIDILTEETGIERSNWYPVAAIDTMEWRYTDFSTDALWQQASLGLRRIGDPNELAGSAPTEAGCRNLPRGIGHGYPAEEGLYLLGAERELRPNGIGFAHGYDSYGWNYGDNSWFGHLGVATPWPGMHLEDGVSHRSELTYHDGFMTTEVVHAEWLAGKTESLSRSRTLDGRTVTDTLVLGAFTDDLAIFTLEMELDEDGRVVARERLMDEVPLDAHAWTRDDAGRVLTYHFERLVDALPLFSSNIFVRQAAGNPDGSFDTLHFEWTADGRLARRWVEGGTAETTPETRTYDDAGRLVSIENGLGAGAYDQTWTYRSDGQLDVRCQTWTRTDEICTRHVYDELDRLAEVWEERDGESWQRNALAYTCAE